MKQNYIDFFIEIGLMLLILSPLAASILLGIFVSWWFMFINAVYLIIIPLIVYTMLKMVTIYADHD